MDEIYGILVTFDYPDAMTGGLRRTTDNTRGILERTRGDLSWPCVSATWRNAGALRRAPEVNAIPPQKLRLLLRHPT